jgi:hypothetical protein
MLVTDRSTQFPVDARSKPDWGCDSGIFFRATESGAAYQITMDYLGTGSSNLGRMIEGWNRWRGRGEPQEDHCHAHGSSRSPRSGDLQRAGSTECCVSGLKRED